MRQFFLLKMCKLLFSEKYLPYFAFLIELRFPFRKREIGFTKIKIINIFNGN